MILKLFSTSVKSGNVLYNTSVMGKGAVYKRRAYRQNWETLILNKFGYGKKKVTEKVYLIIIRFPEKRKRIFDKDNFITGCKPICDNFVRLSLAFDDSDRWMYRDYFQFKLRNERPKTAMLYTLTLAEHLVWASALKKIEIRSLEHTRNLLEHPQSPQLFLEAVDKNIQENLPETIYKGLEIGI